ncbi:hypothetical protein ACFX19_002616 [Malus domestica]
MRELADASKVDMKFQRMTDIVEMSNKASTVQQQGKNGTTKRGKGNLGKSRVLYLPFPLFVVPFLPCCCTVDALLLISTMSVILWNFRSTLDKSTSSRITLL